LAHARAHGDAVRAWQENDQPRLVTDRTVQPPADENIHSSLACLTPERFAHAEETVHFLKMIATIPPGLVADPTAPGKRKDVLRYAIAELQNAGFLRAEDISPLIDDCYGDGDTSAAKQTITRISTLPLAAGLPGAPAQNSPASNPVVDDRGVTTPIMRHGLPHARRGRSDHTCAALQRPRLDPPRQAAGDTPRSARAHQARRSRRVSRRSGRTCRTERAVTSIGILGARGLAHTEVAAMERRQERDGARRDS